MFEQAFRTIDDVLRKETGCTTELDYPEQTSWLLFLKYLDGLEQDKAMEAVLVKKNTPISSPSLIAGTHGPRRKTRIGKGLGQGKHGQTMTNGDEQDRNE